MGYLLLYIIFCIAGGFYGNYLKKRDKKLTWSSKFQTAMLIVLLFTMGSRLGANQRIINNLSGIGLTSLLITIFVLAGSVIAIFIMRKLIGINKVGDGK
ncbi:MAG: hypothetical protein CR995_00170 [Clostridiales bacterium]|nr:MAG: hypothetical protein CR995_00170 [Clostridiales bacterium]